MKTTRITITMLLAAMLFASCSKDKQQLAIIAENMDSGGKVWMNPASPSGAQWVAGETIDLNGTLTTIATNGSSYYLDGIEPLGTDMYAIYPGGSFGGNDVEVTNNNGLGGTVILKRLVVDFQGTGGHTAVFPMVSNATADSPSLLFDHLTAGFRITITNSTGAPLALGSVKIVTQTASAASPIAARYGVTAQWATQGPTLPGGEIGGSSEDHSALYCSEMNFDLKTDGTANVAIADGESISFCVPVTVSSVEKLTVTGFTPAGAQCFVESKSLTPAVAIGRNKIYTIPTIEIE